MSVRKSFEKEYILNLKKEGNEFFKKDQFKEALEKYSEALNAKDWPLNDEQELRGQFLSNRAICYLNSSQFELCLKDCLDALKMPKISQEISRKLLFRKAQALASLGKRQEAIADLRDVLKSDPTNKAAKSEMEKIMVQIQVEREKAQKQSSIIGVLQSINNNENEDSKEDENKLNQILAASREESTVVQLSTIESIQTIQSLLSKLKSKNSLALLMRLLIHLCSHKQFATTFINFIDLKLMKNLANSNHESLQSVSSILSGLLLILAQINTTNQTRLQEVKASLLDMILSSNDTLLLLNTILKVPLTHSEIDTIVRKRINELLELTLDPERRKLVAIAISKLLELASHSETPQPEQGPSKKGKEEEEEKPALFKMMVEKIQTIIHDLIETPDSFGILKGLCALSSILTADLQVGTDIFIKELQNIVDSFDVFATNDMIIEEKKNGDSENNKNGTHKKRSTKTELQLMVAELLAYASANQNFQKMCEPQLLQDLLGMLQSDDEEVSARIFVATSKLVLGNEKIRAKFFSEPKKVIGALSGLLNAAAVKDEAFQKEQTLKTTNNNSTTTTNNKIRSQESDTIQWVVEALSFLSLEAESKELICGDSKLMNALFRLAKQPEKTEIWYGLTVLIDNLCKFQTQSDEVEQLQGQLKRFASGEHMKKIEVHPFNKNDAVEKRCSKLVDLGLVSVLFTMTKEVDEKRSLATRELLADIFVQVATCVKVRGKIVQDGGVKAMMALSEKNTEKGKKMAIHAAAKTLITIDPSIIRDEQIASLVPLMCNLIKPVEEDLETFECVMAITNLALKNEETVEQILRGVKLSTIESLQMSQNELTQRAASELMCNLLRYPPVLEQMKEKNGTNDRRMKIWAGLSGSDDLPTARASGGAIAIMTEDPEVAILFLETVGMNPILHLLEQQEHPDLQHRGIAALRNMLDAEQIGQFIDAECVKLTKGVASLSKSQDARQIAEECIQIMKQKGFTSAAPDTTSNKQQTQPQPQQQSSNQSKKKSKNKK